MFGLPLHAQLECDKHQADEPLASVHTKSTASPERKSSPGGTNAEKSMFDRIESRSSTTPPYLKREERDSAVDGFFVGEPKEQTVIDTRVTTLRQVVACPQTKKLIYW